jgi:hypothetical protein
MYASQHGGFTLVGEITELSQSTLEISGDDSELVLDLGSALSFDYKDSREAATDVSEETRKIYPSVIDITFPHKVRVGILEFEP